MSDFSVSASAVTVGVGATTEVVTAGATVTAGQACYLDLTDAKKAKPCDASSLTASVFKGIALNAATNGQKLVLATKGDVNMGSTFGTGPEVIVVSDNAVGGLAPCSDITSGWYGTVIGMNTSNTVLTIKPIISGLRVVPG